MPDLPVADRPPVAPPASPALSRALVRLTEPRWAITFLILAAFAARCVQFGNPVVQVDDQFYLLVGDRMLHGALPFVDIWDRKPIGLFLLYAAIRLLGGEGVIEYQVVATLFVAATAVTLWAAARTIASPLGALGAGLIYILSLGMFGGEAGQSPAFYNLFVALSGWCMVRVVSRPQLTRASQVEAAAAMLLMGLAIQIKYSVVFEGAFFGCVLLHHAWRGRTRLPVLAGCGSLWAVLGLGPTALAWGWYAAHGHNAAFVYANFTSIFARSSDPTGQTIGRLLGMIGLTLPIAYTAFVGLWPRRGTAMPQPDKFVLGWCIAAIAGVLVFGSYFDHYALPMFVPLALGAARVMGDPAAGISVVANGRARLIQAVLALSIICAGVTIATIDKNHRVRGTGRQVREMTAFLKPRLHDCLFVYDGEPILYHLTDSCLPTVWPFPDHLNNKREDGAVGVDVLAETQRIMARRPQFVVSSDRPETKMNMRTWDYMVTALARDYREAGRWKVGSRFRVIYERRPGR